MVTISLEHQAEKSLGQYELKAVISRTAHSIVYLAHQPSVGRDVAIKIVASERLGDEILMARFKREAHILAHLEHRSIAPLFDYGEVDGQPYLVMPYATGTLADWLKERKDKPLSLKEIWRLLGQLAAALDFIHQHGIVHRDCKPSNVLVDKQGNARWIDFGIAKPLEENDRLTVTGAFIGTPTYTAPEQVKGGPVDRRADIYSLGVMLYEMVTGQVPYQGSTPVAMALAHIQEPPVPPRELDPTIPEPIQAVILEALEKDPDDRYQTAGELAAAWRQAMNLVDKLIEENHYGPEDREENVVKARDNSGKLIAVSVRIGGSFIALALALALVFNGKLPLTGQAIQPTESTPAPTVQETATNILPAAENQQPSISGEETVIDPTPQAELPTARATGPDDTGAGIYERPEWQEKHHFADAAEGEQVTVIGRVDFNQYTDAVCVQTASGITGWASRDRLTLTDTTASWYDLPIVNCPVRKR